MGKQGETNRDGGDRDSEIYGHTHSRLGVRARGGEQPRGTQNRERHQEPQRREKRSMNRERETRSQQEGSHREEDTDRRYRETETEGDGGERHARIRERAACRQE